MADIDFQVDTSAINQVLDALENSRNTRGLMENIGAALRADSQLNFRRESSFEGQPWAPLKSRTGKILSDTRRLRNSITYGLIGDDSVAIGTNVIYARAHNYGIPERNLPARPFLGIGDRQVKKINALVDAWAEDLLGGS